MTRHIIASVGICMHPTHVTNRCPRSVTREEYLGQTFQPGAVSNSCYVSSSDAWYRVLNDIAMGEHIGLYCEFRWHCQRISTIEFSRPSTIT